MTSSAAVRLNILTGFIISLLLLIPTTDSQAAFNARLKNGVKGTPGVKARLTKKGFNYMGRIIGNLFAEQVPMFTVPDISQSLASNSGTLRLTDVRITKFQPPKAYQMSAAPPNQVRLTLINMAVTAIGNMDGSVNIIAPLELQGELEVEAEDVDIILNSALEKTSDGLPHLRILQCTGRIGKIRVVNHNGGVAGAGVDIFQTIIARQAHQVLQNLMCLRAKELVEKELNNRLSDSPPVVSLARARQIDLFGLEASRPTGKALDDEAQSSTRRPMLVNGRMIRIRLRRQISRRIPQSLPSSHVMVHKPRVHRLTRMRNAISERSTPAVDEASMAEQYAYPSLQLPSNHKKSSTIMSTPAEASQFSPVFRAPAIRLPKTTRRPSGISKQFPVTQNVTKSDGLPPAQASLFAPSAIPAVGAPEEKNRQSSEKLPSAAINRAETFVSDTPASTSSPSVADKSTRRGRIRPQPEAQPLKLDREPMIAEVSLDELPTKISKKGKTSSKVLNRLMEIFDLSTAVENLFLDYSLLTTPKATSQFIEVQSAGEISYKGLGGTPFFPVVKPFPVSKGEPKMLEVVVSDYLPNSLLYHANRLNLFNFHIDPDSKEVGQFLWTTCDHLDVAFCLGTFLPSLQKFPEREIHLIYKTTLAPSVVFGRSSSGAGVMKIDILGVLDVYTRAVGHVHHRFSSVDIQLLAEAEVSLNGRIITAKVKFEKLIIKTHDEKTLPQTDLDDLGLIAQEALEGIVNSMLEDGIPVPLHPLFELVNPKVDILDRELFLSTDVKVNEKALKEMTRRSSSAHQRSPIQRGRVKRRH